jgi:hypothetical protein
MGVTTCKMYILLMTKGGNRSKECQYEIGLIANLIVSKGAEVIPIYYPCFDSYDIRKGGPIYAFKWSTLQNIKRGSMRNKLMKVLKMLPEK